MCVVVDVLLRNEMGSITMDGYESLSKEGMIIDEFLNVCMIESRVPNGNILVAPELI